MNLKPTFFYTISLLFIGVVAWAAIPEQKNRNLNIPGELTPASVKSIEASQDPQDESLIWEFGKVKEGDNLSKIFHRVAPKVFNSYVLASSFSTAFNIFLS